MTLSWADKKILSQVRMSKAYEFLEDAKGNCREGRFKTSINRSYYALLAASRSLLILEGANPETHEGAVTMLSLKFIKTARLSVETVKKFKLLFSRRADADYGDFDAVDSADAEEAIRSLSPFATRLTIKDTVTRIPRMHARALSQAVAELKNDFRSV